MIFLLVLLCLVYKLAQTEEMRKLYKFNNALSKNINFNFFVWYCIAKIQNKAKTAPFKPSCLLTALAANWRSVKSKQMRHNLSYAKRTKIKLL